LEKRATEAEKRVAEERDKAEVEKEKFEEEKLRLREEKRDLEREVAVCRRDVRDKEKKEEELTAAGKKVEALREDVNALTKQNAELKLIVERTEMENEKLSSKVEIYSRELEMVSANLAEFKGSTERYATQMKKGQEAALKAAHEKYEKVLKINHEIKKTADGNAAVYQRQKTKYLKVIRHFKKSNALVKAEMEELKALNENLGHNVPAETHFALKKKLKEMMGRHAEFQSLLLYAAPEAANAAAAASSGNSFLHASGYDHPAFFDEDVDAFALPKTVPRRRGGQPLPAASAPDPILRNASQNPTLPDRKTKSAIASFDRPKIRTQSLEDLKEVKERAEKLHEIQEDQDKEIEKHLEIISSLEMPDDKSADADDVAEKAGDLPPRSPVSSVSAKEAAIDYSTDSFSDDKENF